MKLRLSYLVALALATGRVNAEERHLGPHVHGQATVEVSSEGSTLEVDLSLPGHDAVGFEHPPATPGQVRALGKARDVLLGGTWLQPADAAGCKVSSARLVDDGFDANAKPGAHGDFDVSYRFTCATPGRLDAMEVGLFKAFATLQRVVVDVVAANGATEQLLDRPATHVALSP